MKYANFFPFEVTVTAKKPENAKSLVERIEDMEWQMVKPNANGNTGRYNKPERSTDQNYSDDFLKWYYDINPTGY